MKTFWCEVEGHACEFRIDFCAGQTMHVNGKRVGKNTNYFSRAGLSSEIIGENGERHVVEMRLVDTSRLQLERYVVRVTLNGRLVAVIDPRKEWQADDQCPFCQYDLSATPTVNREVACPECGRHSAAASLGRQKSSSGKNAN